MSAGGSRMMGKRLLVLLLACGIPACATAPAFRVAALVRVEGRGQAAWLNAREAARAVTLRQNLRRLIREVRPGRLRMLDADDPFAVLQDAVVARRDGPGRVLVRIYGDSDWELLELCRALLNLWESEGILGVTPSSGLISRPWTGKVRSPTPQERGLARARADAEGEERRLYREKQRALAEQVTLGRRWQDAERIVESREKELLAAQKLWAERRAELRRVRGILRQAPAERFRLLGDADALRLQADVRALEASLQRATSAAERGPIQVRLERKRRALDLAQARFERGARVQRDDAAVQVRAARRALDEARAQRSALRVRRRALARRLAQVGERSTAVRQRLKTIAGREEVSLRPARAQGDVAVYRVKRVLRGCRSERLGQD